MTHDLLISKRGVVAPASHVLKLAITRHKARLSAEFTKVRIRRGHATLEAFRNAIQDGPLAAGPDRPPVHPRWVRVNSVKTTLARQLATTFSTFTKAEIFEEIMSAPPSAKKYFVDQNIPNLLALPPKVDMSKMKAYAEGDIIFQDKASCFPAYLLDPRAGEGDIIDGTAAPGNKTSHLAAILSEKISQGGKGDTEQGVIAFERDRFRTKTLEKMIKLASADNIVTIKGSTDFMDTRPNSEEYANVGAILLDPSCSGSGIVGRDDAITMHLPDPNAAPDTVKKPSKAGNKRKRNEKEAKSQSGTLKMDLDDSVPEETPVEDKLSERLTALAQFQLKIVRHAMRFPRAQRITYSTCSIHFEENESVVFQALNSPEARKFGWKIMKRKDQVSGLQSWPRRGVWEDDKLGEDVPTDDKEEVLDACIRCNKATEDGTMGFFVAGFVRDASAAQDDIALPQSEKGQAENQDDNVEIEDDEWSGFSEDDNDESSTSKTKAVEAPVSQPTVPKKKLKNKKRKTQK